MARKEGFECVHCGQWNECLGSGTRNHCKCCLWSKHVDLELPGDRASECGGAMRVVAAETKNAKWMVVQKCEKCGHIWKNKMSADDDFEVLIKIAEENAKGLK